MLMKSAFFWVITRRRVVIITTRRRVITQKTTDFISAGVAHMYVGNLHVANPTSKESCDCLQRRFINPGNERLLGHGDLQRCKTAPSSALKCRTAVPATWQTVCSSALVSCKDSSSCRGTRKGSCDVIIDICSFHADDVVAVVALVRTNDLVFAPVEMCVASLHACVWEQGWRLLRAQRSGVRIPVR